MIKAFNALQIVAIFAALPFLIAWLGTATFAGSVAALAVAITVYVVLFFIMCVNTYHGLGH